MSAFGSDVASDDDLMLVCTQLPQTFGYFLASRTQGLSQPPSSNGPLCLGGDIARFRNRVCLLGSWCAVSVDLSSIPTNPPSAVLPGETWHFQLWYRDLHQAGKTTNFSDGRPRASPVPGEPWPGSALVLGRLARSPPASPLPMSAEPDRFPPSSVVRRAPNQTSCDLGDERVLLNVDTGIYFGLDAIGSRIWEHLQEPRTFGRLLELLLEEFDVDPATCERDVAGLLGELAGAGLIEVEAEVEGGGGGGG